MSFIEALKLVGQGGFPVLFALLVIGLGYLVVKLGPQVLGAWNAQTAAIAALTAKVESMQTTLEAMRTKVGDTAEDMAALATGRHQAVTEEDLRHKPGTYAITERDRRR